MNGLLEACRLAIQCVRRFESVFSGQFQLTILTAVALSILGWVVCSKWTYFWNKAFRARSVHQTLCGLAAVLTFLFVLLYASLSMLNAVTEECIEVWSKMLATSNNSAVGLSAEEARAGREWNAETFFMARHEVFLLQKKGASIAKFSPEAWQSSYALNPSGPYNGSAYKEAARKNGWKLDPDESQVRPSDDHVMIPADDDGPIDQKTAEIYANRATALFRVRYPLLGRIIWPPEANIPRSLIQEDMKTFQRQHPRENYPLTQASDIARRRINTEYQTEIPRVVKLARLGLVGLFFLAQAIPFGLIGWAAYRDLQAHRQERFVPLPSPSPT